MPRGSPETAPERSGEEMPPETRARPEVEQPAPPKILKPTNIARLTLELSKPKSNKKLIDKYAKLVPAEYKQYTEREEDPEVTQAYLELIVKYKDAYMNWVADTEKVHKGTNQKLQTLHKTLEITEDLQAETPQSGGPRIEGGIFVRGAQKILSGPKAAVRWLFDKVPGSRKAA